MARLEGGRRDFCRRLALRRLLAALIVYTAHGPRDYDRADRSSLTSRRTKKEALSALRVLPAWFLRAAAMVFVFSLGVDGTYNDRCSTSEPFTLGCVEACGRDW